MIKNNQQLYSALLRYQENRHRLSLHLRVQLTKCAIKNKKNQLSQYYKPNKILQMK